MDPAIASGFIWFVAFLFSTTVHEAMHALVAWKGGDPTAYHGGQVSLSPIPHIKREPIGMLVVPLLTSLTQGWAMGWASAPYDPLWAERHPQRAALMAAAGPAGNFMIALVAFAGLRAGLLTGLFVAPQRAAFHALVADAGTGDPNLLGTVLSVMVWPSLRYWPGLPVDTRSRYCSPMAETECTFADASTGILNWLSMLISARAPCSVGVTDLTLPIVVPRYVTFAVAYKPPDRGRSAYSLYCPMPAKEGSRR